LLPDDGNNTPFGRARATPGHTAAVLAPALHEISLERRALHGHFSRDLAPVLEIDPGDKVRFSTLDAGWGLEAPHPDRPGRRVFEPRQDGLDEGHALIGPIAVRG
jgi:acetamidase/formamidase